MRILIPLTLLALLLWLFIGSWWYARQCCSVSSTTTAAAPTPLPSASPTTASQLRIADASRFSTAANDNLLFANNSFDFNKPLSPDLTRAYGELAAYLKANPQRRIALTGLYGSKERNSSLLPNMGLARAANLKQYLESIGINPAQIVTQGQLQPNFALNNEQIVGGMLYGFDDMPAATPAPDTAQQAADNARLDQIARDLQADPIVLYFETAKSTIEVNDQMRQKFARLIEYLTQRPQQKAIVEGHTDNVGPEKINLQYGSERAEFAKSYMVKNGLNPDRITTSSQGEANPVAPNNTTDGRAKNRRAEVSIQ